MSHFGFALGFLLNLEGSAVLPPGLSSLCDFSTCSGFLSVTGKEHSDQKQLRRKGWVYFSLQGAIPPA